MVARFGNRNNRAMTTRLSCLCLAAIGALMFAAPATAQQPPVGVGGEAWAGIQEQIEAERHKITESDRPGRLYRADNPVQRFTAHFGAEDVVIVPRGRGEPAWELGMRLTAWGAAHDLQPVHPAGAIAEDNRVEYRRGPLTEWYINTTMGLEQGFTIEAPPGNDIDELVLEMTLAGDLTPVFSKSEQGVTFKREGSTAILTYTGLLAWDAVGEPLDARMELEAGGTRLLLVVSIPNAAWPITVDPIFTQVAKLLPTPRLHYYYTGFGVSVAVDSEFMVVGLEDDENGTKAGAAYVFQRDHGGTNNWGQVARLVAADGAAQDYFGDAVSISGDTIVVGAWGDDDNGSSSGSAYVFQRDQGGPGSWGQVVKVTANDGGYSDHFGYSVSISGDTICVGAATDDDNGYFSGSAYIFERDQGGPNAWGEIVKITPVDGSYGDRFGTSVSISGETAVVGAHQDDDNGTDSGSAYVFHRDHGGPEVWGQIAKITPSDGAFNDRFGFSLAIAGDTAVIGSEWDDDNGSSSGSAFVFQRDQGGIDAWGQVAKITPADGGEDNRFGHSVSIIGDTALVGSYSDDDNGDYSGSAYVFQRNQGGTDAWGEVAKITPADGATGDVFGDSVALSGDNAVVGATGDDDFDSSSGSTYIFGRDQGGPDAWGQVTKRSCPGALTARDDVFGTSVSISADTAIIGAPHYPNNPTEIGSAYVFQRNQDGTDAWGLTTRLTNDDGEGGDWFGYTVSVSGDAAIVGAWGDDINGAYSGSVYVFRRDHGGPDSWGQVAKITPLDGAVAHYFGYSVSMSGDIAIVGAFGDGDNGSYSGSAYVFQRDHGEPDSWGQVAKITPLDGAEEDYFGVSVSISSDTAVVGAHVDDDLGENSGSAYVFQRDLGGPDAWGQLAKLTASDGEPGDRFGSSVAISDETLIVGAPKDDDNLSNSGSAYIFRRNQDGSDAWVQISKITPTGGVEDERFGASITVREDTAMIGASGNYPATIPGSAYIFRREPSAPNTWRQVARITPADGTAGIEFGRSVSLSGGIAIIGAPRSNSIGTDSGSAYVFTISDAFFADGFETGDTSGWSGTVP